MVRSRNQRNKRPQSTRRKQSLPRLQRKFRLPLTCFTELSKFSPSAPAELAAEKQTPETQARLSRQALFEERARNILAKYDLVLEPDFMPAGTITTPAATVERVHKSIRIRVHRYCHRCEAVFGPDRICAKCDHKRCKKCPRYPTEKKSNEGAGGKRDRSTPGKGKDRARSETREPLLVIQSRGTGQILVHQPIMQRIRRTCHKCDMQFLPSSAQMCANCGHVRCTKCPRSPAKLNKWESGYPGDQLASSEEEEQANKRERVFRKPRQRVRWHCDQCTTLFLEGSKTCRNCGHRKCENCTRHP